MAQLFKGSILDDSAYPMPQPLPAVGAAHAADGVDPARLGGAADDLERIVQAVSSLAPQVSQVTETLRADARQQGYHEGIALAESEVQRTMVEAMSALTDAQRQRHEIAEQHEGAIAELALRIARKVIGAHLDADPTLVASIVAATIAELEPTTRLTVHVNPADVAAVESARADLERLVEGTGAIEITGDDAVGAGGCVLVSPVGEVDARIETKLSVLETAFRAQRRQIAEGTA